MSKNNNDLPAWPTIPKFDEYMNIVSDAVAPDPEVKRTETKKDYQQVSMLIRKKYYKQLKKESLTKDKFIYQVLDEALALWLNSKLA